MRFRRLSRSTRSRPIHRPTVETLDARVLLSGSPTLSVNDAMVLEGDGGQQVLVFTVRLSKRSKTTVSVEYDTADLTARAGSDYAAVSGTLTFARGQTSKTITVPVYGDRAAEGDERFVLRLRDSRNATIVDDLGVGTIHDNEPVIHVGGTASVGDFSTTFTVSLSAAYDQPVTVDFATVDGTASAGRDYTPLSGTLTFAPGERFKTITVEYFGSRTYQDFFYLALSNPSSNASIGEQYAIGGSGDDGSQGSGSNPNDPLGGAPAP